MALRQQSLAGSSTAAPEDILDTPLHQFGFVFDCYTADKVSGQLLVTPLCCQPFKKLHGGMTAMMAESLASMGGILAAGVKKVAGIQLSINHLKSAQLGDTVYGEAKPVTVGKSIQVWEVKFWKTTPATTSEERSLISLSRVTIVSNMHISKEDKDKLKHLEKYAKL